jgi:hypothetical protein
MSYSILSILPWLLTVFFIEAMYITSAVVLLRERHVSAWMMLAGSCISLLGQTGAMVYPRFMMGTGNFIVEYVQAIYAFSALGALLFAIGLLLQAFRQRSKSNRIQELEAILASLQERGAHQP